MNEAVNEAAVPAPAAPVVPEAPTVESLQAEQPASAAKESFTDAELREFKAKGNTANKPSSKTDSAPVETKPAVEAKPEAKPTPEPAPGKPERKAPDPLVENVRKAAEENKRLRDRIAELEKPPSPPAAPAPAKPEAAAPADDPEPDIEKYSAEDLGKFFKDQREWVKRETARGVAAGLKAAKDADAATAAKEAETKRHSELAATQKKLDTELKDWTKVVIGTKEEPGLIAAVPEELSIWASSKGESAFRGLYAIAKLPESELADFLSLPFDEQVAEVIAHGKQKKSNGAPVLAAPVGTPKVPAPPPKEVGGVAAPSADPIKEILSSKTLSDAQVRDFKTRRNAEESAARKR